MVSCAWGFSRARKASTVPRAAFTNALRPGSQGAGPQRPNLFARLQDGSPQTPQPAGRFKNMKKKFGGYKWMLVLLPEIRPVGRLHTNIK